MEETFDFGCRLAGAIVWGVAATILGIAVEPSGVLGAVAAAVVAPLAISVALDDEDACLWQRIVGGLLMLTGLLVPGVVVNLVVELLVPGWCLGGLAAAGVWIWMWRTFFPEPWSPEGWQK